MSDHIPVIITVQIEQHSGQLVRGRPLGPWKVQAVGASPSEVCKKLQRRLRRLLPKALPTHYFEGALPEEHERWIAAVELCPPQQDPYWHEPVQIELGCFRWELRNGQSVVRIPALGCTLFGKREKLSEAEVANQARIGLLREAEDLNLLQLKKRFVDKTYFYRSLRMQVPLSLTPKRGEQKKNEREKTSTLRATASDLTNVRLPPIFGMDELAGRLAQHFLGEPSQSVLLVGPAGVGKSSLVHHLVTMRNELALADRKVWSTSGARIVSGMSGLGMWQERCTKLIRQAHASRAIVHLGSLFELMEAGKVDGQPGVASMLRNAIGRHRLLAIAECTPEQLAIIGRDDPMLLRVFTRFEIKEPSGEKVLEILRMAAQEIHGAEMFSRQAIEELHRLHTRFATYSALPAAALKLMRTMHTPGNERRSLDADDVARAFAKQTGLPRFLVDDSIRLDLSEVRRALTANVIGQAEPVDLIVNLIATMKARLVRPGRPLATLMFIGPTGVGKTEMAKAIARLLYSDIRRMIRIDMSEYASPWSAAKLIGKPGEGDGMLTSPIREQPFSVVLLDEFEKADSNVFDLLLQLLGEGRLTDSQGRLADFRNAVIIMTSNLGAESFRDASFGFSDGEPGGWKEHFGRELRKFVRPEFLGRIDRIVPFQPLPRDIVKQIAVRELGLLRNRTGMKYSEASLEFDPEAVDRLCELGYQPKYGARPLRRAIEENVTVPLANALSSIKAGCSCHFRVGVKEREITVTSERVSTKTESSRDEEMEIINSWQELGAMARTARSSGPLRSLENELERGFRLNEILKKKLTTISGPRRLASLKEDLSRSEAAVQLAKRLKEKLFEITDELTKQQLMLMLSWHRNESIPWESYAQLGKQLLSQLRQITEDIVQRRVAAGNSITLMVIGSSKPHLEVMWNAYEILAGNNGWIVDRYIAKPYDPLLDRESPEFRKRVSERKQDKTERIQPAVRLLSVSKNDRGQQDRVCNLFRHSDQETLLADMDSVAGFVLQIRGDGAGTWLEDEHGTVHFFDSRATGAKRRVRVKVSVFEGQLLSIELPSDWQDPISAPDRDPRRILDTVCQEIYDSHGNTISYSKGKQSEALAELIAQEHEQALWRAIGYHGVPPEALLHKDSETLL